MFGLFSKSKQIHAIAKRLVNRAVMTEPLIVLDGLESLEANSKFCDATKGPILMRILLLEYVLVNFARAEIGVAGATEKDYETLVYFVTYEMKSHPMFGDEALSYWADLKDVAIAASHFESLTESPIERLARIYGFWILKNVGYPDVNLSSTESLLVGVKAIENFRKIFEVANHAF
jgi:hypothetical protein